MAVQIEAVTPGSPAARARIRPGDTLLEINGREIDDVLGLPVFHPRYTAEADALLRRPHTPCAPAQAGVCGARGWSLPPI